jgi:pantothenate synthetase
MLYRALGIAAEEGAEKAVEFLRSEPRIRLEYLEFVDPVDMQPVNGREPPVLIAIAAWIGSVRLIDNLFVPA